MLIVATAVLLAWLITYRNAQLRTKFFNRHYLLSLLSLLASAVYAGGLGCLWMSQSSPGIFIGIFLLLVGIVFGTVATLKLLVSTDTRYLKLGKLFRNLTRHEAAPLGFSVDNNVGENPWTRPRRTHEVFEVLTEDHIKIRGLHISAGHRNVVIIAHGSFRSKNTAAYVFLAQWLAYKYDVIAFDFRGHGESEGEFDFSDAPVLDLKAVVDYARSKGYQKVGVFGRSLGGWIALLQAAKYKNVDTVVAAAAPLGQITDIDTAQKARRLFNLPVVGKLIAPIGQWGVAILRGTRMSGIVDAKQCPIDVVAHVAPIPVFFIYQEYDWVIKTNVQDAVRIFEAADGHKQLLVLAGPGHIFEVHQFHSVYSAIESWFDKTFGSQSTPTTCSE